MIVPVGVGVVPVTVVVKASGSPTMALILLETTVVVEDLRVTVIVIGALVEAENYPLSAGVYVPIT